MFNILYKQQTAFGMTGFQGMITNKKSFLELKYLTFKYNAR